MRCHVRVTGNCIPLEGKPLTRNQYLLTRNLQVPIDDLTRNQYLFMTLRLPVLSTYTQVFFSRAKSTTLNWFQAHGLTIESQLRHNNQTSYSPSIFRVYRFCLQDFGIIAIENVEDS